MLRITQLQGIGFYNSVKIHVAPKTSSHTTYQEGRGFHREHDEIPGNCSFPHWKQPFCFSILSLSKYHPGEFEQMLIFTNEYKH